MAQVRHSALYAAIVFTDFRCCFLTSAASARSWFHPYHVTRDIPPPKSHPTHSLCLTSFWRCLLVGHMSSFVRRPRVSADLSRNRLSDYRHAGMVDWTSISLLVNGAMIGLWSCQPCLGYLLHGSPAPRSPLCEYGLLCIPCSMPSGYVTSLLLLCIGCFTLSSAIKRTAAPLLSLSRLLYPW